MAKIVQLKQLFKLHNINPTNICSKSTIEEGINMLKTPEQRSRRSSGVFDFAVNFEHTLHLFLVFLLLTLNKEIFAWIQS